jgi:hypothetical protein
MLGLLSLYKVAQRDSAEKPSKYGLDHQAEAAQNENWRNIIIILNVSV